MTINNDNNRPSFELNFDQPDNFQPTESIAEPLNDDAEDLLDGIQDSSVRDRLGELEIKLGMARREGRTQDVETLEAEIADVREELAPSYEIPETPFPSPLTREAYHGLAGEIIGAVEPHSEADPVALLMNLLTSFGNVIGDGAWVSVGADRHECNLFCASVGDTAKGRKGTSWGPVRVLLRASAPEWTEHRIQSGLSSGEGLVYHVRDEIYKTVPDKKTGVCELVDGGVQDKRLLAFEGELAQVLKVLGREGNTLSPILRNAWDGGKIQTLTKNSPVTATGAHISIIGHITKQELLRGLDEMETGNGFANRFLWFCVKRSKCLPFGGDFDAVDMDGLASKLRQAIEFGKQAGRVTWSKATEDLWEKVYPDLSEGKPGLVGAITGRAEAQVIRLACIYALLDLSTEIEPEHLKAAIAIWSYAEASVKYIFQGRSLDPLANRILEALASKPRGMTRNEIRDLLGRNYTSARIKEALNQLKDSGFVKCEFEPTKGRPSERWTLVKGGTR